MILMEEKDEESERENILSYREKDREIRASLEK